MTLEENIEFDDVDILFANPEIDGCEYVYSDDFEILTEDGWKDFSGIKRKLSSDLLRISFSDGSSIDCTKSHLILTPIGFVKAEHLRIGSKIKESLYIEQIDSVDGEQYVYDCLDVKDTRSYITNSITSHNCAFVENFEEFSASVMPTLSSGKHTRMIFTSTPNGLNHFYYYCDGAKNGTNGFSYLEVPWYRVPGRDEKWKQETLGTINNDLQKFETEYSCAFEGSSGTLISGAALKTLRPDVPLHVNPGYGYRVYATPEPSKSYIIVVDVSRGKGLDYSAFHVIDVSDVPYRQVATFKNNMITPIDYAEYIYRTAVAYNNAYVLVEVNDIGGQVSDLLYFDYGYESVIHTENHGRSGKRVSGGFGKNIDRGIRTTKTVKALGCSMLKLLIEQKKLIVIDKDTIGELGVFSKKGTSYEAEPGHNDDLVMGLVLFGWLTQDSFFKEMNDTDIMHYLREQNEDDIVENLVSFGFRYDATDEYTSGTYEKLDDGGWWAKAGM